MRFWMVIEKNTVTQIINEKNLTLIANGDQSTNGAQSTNAGQNTTFLSGTSTQAKGERWDQ